MARNGDPGRGGRRLGASLALMALLGAPATIVSARSAGAVAVPASTLTGCDEAGFRAAVGVGGTVTFAASCTILLSAPIVIGAGLQVDIEGNANTVILDGQSQVRLFDVQGGHRQQRRCARARGGRGRRRFRWAGRSRRQRRVRRGRRGDGAATISFVAPSDDGGSPISFYTVAATDLTLATRGGQLVGALSSPITVVGLTDGDSYTFTVAANNAAGRGPASTASNTVVPAPPLPATATALAIGPDPAAVGQPVTMTATVTPVIAGAAPVGRVLFLAGGWWPLASVPVDAAGHAVFTRSTYAPATRSITATYGGSATYAGSISAAVTFTVVQAATSVSIVGPPTSLHGQVVRVSATVVVLAPGSGAATGRVAFFNGPWLLGVTTLDASGVASLDRAYLASGTRSIVARYLGSSLYGAANSPVLRLGVQRGQTTVTLTSDAPTAPSGQTVTFSAAVGVVAPAVGPADAVVDLYDNGILIASVSPVAGVATFATSTLSIGDHLITATSRQDPNFASSTSATLTQPITP